MKTTLTYEVGISSLRVYSMIEGIFLNLHIVLLIVL